MESSDQMRKDRKFWSPGRYPHLSGGVLFSPPMNPGSQTLGKVDLEDIFSGVVSTELGPSLETQRHRGRQDHMDKPLLFSIALMNLTLSGSFLIPTETHLCVKLRLQRA